MLVEQNVQTVANSSRRSSTKSLSPADATGPQQVTPHSDGSQAGRGVLLDSLLETLCQHLPAFQWSLRLQTPHVSAFTRQQYMSVTNAQGLGHWRQTSDCKCLSSLKPAHPAQMRLLGCVQVASDMRHTAETADLVSPPRLQPSNLYGLLSLLPKRPHAAFNMRMGSSMPKLAYDQGNYHMHAWGLLMSQANLTLL